MTETTIGPSISGPTQSCLVAMQFANLKYGDRFWYETTDSVGFSTGEHPFYGLRNYWPSLPIFFIFSDKSVEFLYRICACTLFGALSLSPYRFFGG